MIIQEHLDQLPNASCALFEEPLITPTNVGTWKLLLEGKTIKTDIKHKDKEGIKRIPIWITTASPITTNVDHNETIQIMQRIKLFKFKKSIHHSNDTSTLNTEIRSRRIQRAPHYIKPIHFAFLYAYHFPAITKIVKNEDKENILNETRIIIPDESIEQIQKWHKITQELNETDQTLPLTNQTNDQDKQPTQMMEDGDQQETM